MVAAIDQLADDPREEPNYSDYRRRPSGRRQGFPSTRRDIIQAARKLFAQQGFHGTTMRAIAREARVDSALIHHYFVSKEGVFTAAIGDAWRPEQIIDEVLRSGRGGEGERLIRSFLSLWENPETRDPVLAVIRSAVSYDEAAQVIRDFVAGQIVGHIVGIISESLRQLRTTMIVSQIVGLLMVRYVIGIEPLASIDPELVAALLGPTLDRYLEDDLNIPEELAARGPH